MDFVVLGGAAYLIFIGVLMGTHSLQSALLYKVLPVMLGIVIAFKVLSDVGVL